MFGSSPSFRFEVSLPASPSSPSDPSRRSRAAHCFVPLLVGAALLPALTGCNEVGLGPSGPGSVVEVLAEEGNFDLLFITANEAGLIPVLDRQGPLTLLAPPDAAFRALPESAWNRLRSDPFLIERVLTYHIIPGARTAQQIANAPSVPTLNGRAIRTRISEGRVQVDESFFDRTDLPAGNGVIHVVDRLLLPEVFFELFETIQYRPGLETLETLLALSGLEGDIRSENPLTVLAPSDEAFEALPEAFRAELLADLDLLRRVLLYHVLPAALGTNALEAETGVLTLEGNAVVLQGSGLGLTVNGANFTERNRVAFNGILHVIDEVLLPPDLREAVAGQVGGGG